MRPSLTLLTPFDLLDLVHGAPEDVTLVGLGAEAGDVAHVGRQQLGQLLDVAALQLPSPLLQAAENHKILGHTLKGTFRICRLNKSTCHSDEEELNNTCCTRKPGENRQEVTSENLLR